VTAGLIASHLGLRIMGLAMGLIAAGHALGGAMGAFMGGYLFDIYAQYQTVWFSSLWITILAGLIVCFLRDQPRVAPQLMS
jgi:MFS family permease